VPTNTLFIHCDLVTEGDVLLDLYADNVIPYSYITFSAPNIEHYSKPLKTTNHSSMRISLQDPLGQEVNLNGVDWNFSLMLYKKNDLASMFRNFSNFVGTVYTSSITK
ncbi:MAG: hypothetical protein P4L69_15700, partial [Desulfosporosinus sp.]|nr:hypothetical protein [Desulfosporosinus sp.]